MASVLFFVNAWLNLKVSECPVQHSKVAFWMQFWIRSFDA